MADTPNEGGSFIDRLVQDPKNPPELSLLQGWLGVSSEEGHRRLYLDPELSQSLEIPEGAIVHTQDIPRDQSPLGGSWVWVKADATLKNGPGLERLYARFLRGQIQQDFLGAGGGAMGGAGGTVGAGGVGGVGAAASPLLAASQFIACTPIQTFFNCPTRTLLCRPSQLVICNSSPVLCRITQTPLCFPSASLICATRICPSAVDACPSAPGGCFDPGTIFQDPTILQQPGGFQQPGFGMQGGGVGFDPGAFGGGMIGGGVGAPNPAAPLLAGPWASRLIICRPSQFVICNSSPVLCRVTINPQCLPSAQFICATRICPSAVDGCPSAPGCFDPTQFQTPVLQTPVLQTPVLQQPGGFQQPAAGFQQPGFGMQGGFGFDPGAFGGGMMGGGMVGAPAGPLQGSLVSRIVICRPSVIQCFTQLPQCFTQLPQCITRGPQCLTMLPWCPTAFPEQCVTRIPQQCITHPNIACPNTIVGPCQTLGGCQSFAVCPSIAGCPSGPVCGDPGGLNPGGIQAGGGMPGLAGMGGGFDPNVMGGGQMGFDPSGTVGGPMGNIGNLQFQQVSIFAVCWPTRFGCRTLVWHLCPTWMGAPC